MLATALLLAAGCSSMPAPAPPVREWSGTATLPVGADGWVELPQSGPDLTILALRAEPPALTERFVHGRRQVRVAAGCRQVQLTVHLRAYGQGDDPARWLPGAEQIHELGK